MSTNSKYILHVADTWSDFEALQQPWDELHAACAPGPFVTHVWITAWAESFGSDYSPRIVYVTSDGVMVAAMAMGIRRTRLVTRLKWPVVDCLHMLPNCEGGRIQCLIEPTHQGALAVLFAGVMEKTGKWALARFEPLLNLDDWQDPGVAARKYGIPVTSTVMQRSVIADIQGGWEVYLGKRPRKFRKELRRNAKQVTESGANLLYSNAPDGKLLERVFSLSRNSWKGAAGTAMGGSPERQKFYARVVEHFSALQQMEIYLLEVDGKEAGSLLSLRDNGVAYGLKLDFNEVFGALSPSRFLVGSWIKQNAEDKLNSVDLLWDTPFNRTWSDTEYDMTRLQVFPRISGAAILCKLEEAMRPLGRKGRRLRRRKSRQRAGHRTKVG